MARRLALVDDHVLYREGLRKALEAYAEFQIVGEAGDARGAMALVEAARPEVLLLDLALPGVSGLTVARELAGLPRPPTVLFVSMYDTPDVVSQGLAAGARGWVCKDQSLAELVEAIRVVSGGQPYVPPRLSAHVTVDDPGGGDPLGPFDRLSPREREVLTLLLRGDTNDGIARQLGISGRTVETHRAHVLKKLQVHSLAELFRLAARHGLLRD